MRENIWYFYGGQGQDWDGHGYRTFKEYCPKDSEDVADGMIKYSCGVLLPIALIVKALPSTGPSPWNLAKYINEHIPPGSVFSYSKVYTYDNFEHCARSIASDINHSDPVIAFIFWGPFSWHYANVIATEGRVDNPEGFMLLETDKTFDYRTYDNMRHIMYNDYKFNSSFCLGGTPKNYNIIRFHRREH